ncbi:MAG: flavin monoamine oxidase family protein [Anaerolineae bacterium]
MYPSSSPFTNKKSPKIVIIGAGLSGLTIAYRLHKKGLNVEVYEARNRVGGRVFTVNVMGHLAELGGQNILDGGKAKHTIALINQLRLETDAKRSIFHLNYCDHEKMIDLEELLKDHEFTSQNLKVKLEAIGQKAQNMQEVLKALFNEHPMLYKICRVMLSGYEGASVENLSPFYIETLYHLLLGGICSAHQNNGKEKSTYINHLMIKGGNGLLAESLARELPNRIHLNHRLLEVKKNSKGSYLLTFQKESHTTADILILTIPCPVYKDISISDEVIPRKRRLSIESIRYGTTTKILVPILPTHAKQGAYTNGRVVTFMNRDDYVVNLYYLCEHGRFSAETIKETFQIDLPFIQKIYAVAPSLHPVLAEDRSFSSYATPVGHSWPSDPFAGGSYSCVGAGQEESFTSTVEVGGEVVKTLFAPIDNSLLFAGEHTSILFDVGGTMEAAVESGERIARLVEQCAASHVQR